MANDNQYVQVLRSATTRIGRFCCENWFGSIAGQAMFQSRIFGCRSCESERKSRKRTVFEMVLGGNVTVRKSNITTGRRSGRGYV